MEIPDRWCIINIIKDGDEPINKVFASWYGGYLGGDYWRINSGIVNVTEDDTQYFFHGESGSIYQCNKETYGTTSYGQSVLNGFIKNGEKLGYKITILEETVNFSMLNN
jgi:hypothetical protein